MNWHKYTDKKPRNGQYIYVRCGSGNIHKAIWADGLSSWDYYVEMMVEEVGEQYGADYSREWRPRRPSWKEFTAPFRNRWRRFLRRFRRKDWGGELPF